MKQVDAIIIGSGQSGVPLATDWARGGQQVVLFDRGPLGGSCVNYGCTPSKVFLASAHAAAQARSASELGIQTRVQVDFPAVIKRVRDMVDTFNSGIERRLEKADVEIIRAEATFSGERIVRATDRDLIFQAPVVVINTGKSPFLPDIPGLADSSYLTFEDIWWELSNLPSGP